MASDLRKPTPGEDEQVINQLKRGAHLQKCGKRGEPEFFHFRLSEDEKMLIWYCKEKERKLKLSSISKVVRAQKTQNSAQQCSPEKKSQTFSLVLGNGECSIDLICKDREQAETWYLGLEKAISLSHHSNVKSVADNKRQISSCTSSPPTHVFRRRGATLLEQLNLPLVPSLYGSPRILRNVFHDSKLDSSRNMGFSRKKAWSNIDMYLDKISLSLPHARPANSNDVTGCNRTKIEQVTQTTESLRDIFIWGDLLVEMTQAEGANINVALPRLLDTMQGLCAQSITCGEKNAAIITNQGEVFFWGEDNSGRLSISCPKIVETLKSKHAQAIAFGAKHTCAVLNSGELYEWGEGFDSSRSLYCPRNRSLWFTHNVFGPLSTIRVAKVACGRWHTAIISSSGQLFTYGDGTFGVLGHGDTKNITQPKAVESLNGSRVNSIACGPWHTAAVVEIIGNAGGNTLGRKLFTWGDGDKGKLGHTGTGRKLLPSLVESLNNYEFSQVACGTMMTVALTATGVVFTIGSSVHGQLGNPKALDCSINSVEGLLKMEFVKEISSGSYHVAALTTTGKVYTWGRASEGQLGLGDYADRSLPSLVDSLVGQHTETIACGSNFTAAICLHRPISSKDQLICTGCRLEFGFKRKRHQCYNCGSVFCSSCSSNKIGHKALSPDMGKRLRVCDLCFTKLNATLEVKYESTQASLKEAKIYTPKLSRLFKDANFLSEKMDPAAEANRQRAVVAAEVNRGPAQRWGEVECPIGFCNVRESSIFPPAEMQPFDASHDQGVKKHASSETANKNISKQESHMREKILSEEAKKLQEKVNLLAEQCQDKSLEIQMYKRTIEETWLFAKDEAAKFKAARDIITALTNQINALSEKFSAGHCIHDTDTARQANSGTSSLQPRSNARRASGSSAASRSSSKGGDNCAAATPEDMTEQIECGVYATVAELPGGNKFLKRIRFSRKYFNEAEAEKWWESNRNRVLATYDAEQLAVPCIFQRGRGREVVGGESEPAVPC